MNKFLTLLFIVLISNVVKAQEQFEVYFDANKFNIKKNENLRLQNWITANKDVKIVAINGYTDEDGSVAMNDTLAQKRVTSILNLIKDKVAIRDDFKTRSFGKLHEQSKDKSKNRKATIYYILAKDLARENEILGIKEVAVEPIEIQPIEEEDMNFPEGATLEEKIQLSKKGTLIRLDEINFYLNSFAVIPSSKRAIDELLYVMDNNKNLKIEIQGHICCVNKDARNLSTDRAKQIKRILVGEGIYEKRIKTKGFGVSKPKFPIPEKSEFEAARNRRVEIMILDK